MKKLILKLEIFFRALMFGLKSANKIAFEDKDSNDGGIGGIEQQNEAHNVYKDMLKGEVTQEVKEFRHEMYYSERASHKYEYAGNGTAKRNDFFDYSGKIDRSDGFKVQIVQEVKEEITPLGDMGVTVYGKNVDLDEKAKGDMRVKDKRDFTIKLGRDFLPTMRLEEYTNKLVVKRVDEQHVALDFYTSIYPKQFDNRHRIFVNAIEKIYEGDKRSEILDFNSVNFIAYNAYGSDDLKEYEYNNISFDTILIFDGNYVLRFFGDIVKDGEDLISEFYEEAAAKKSENHEARKGATIGLDTVLAKMAQDEYDTDTAEILAKELNNNGTPTTD